MKLYLKIFWLGSSVLFLIPLIMGGCTPEKPTPPGGPATLTLPAVKLQAFADLPPKEPLAITPVMIDQATVVDQALNYKGVMKFLGVRLSPSQKEFLNRNKFLLIPKALTRFKGKVSLGDLAINEMLGLFDEVGGSFNIMERKPENARLVTPDVVLHAFHKFFQNSLESLEESDLAPHLRSFLKNVQVRALAYQKQSTGKLAEHYQIIAAQLTVPLVLLENARWPIEVKEKTRLPEPKELAQPDDVDSLENALVLLGNFREKFSQEMLEKIEAEIKNIYEAQGLMASPLFRRPNDYTQFTPRGHYAKKSILRGYFRAMMYLGRNGYHLNGPENFDGLTDSLLLAHLMASPDGKGRQPLQDWQRIMEITSFYAGLPDDICYPEWRDFVVKVLGTMKFSPAEAVNQDVLKKISRELDKLRPPQILSEIIISESVPQGTEEARLAEVKVFRIFGQRFTFDGWILSRLSFKTGKPEPRLPSTPSALFVPAALGDNVAREFAVAFLKKDTPPFSEEEIARFSSSLDQVTADLKKVKEGEWFSSVGAAWLKLLGTQTGTYGNGYPLYMQSQLFPLKQLQTFLGSYTELKHDTLLYAKQSYAEGDVEEVEPPPVPLGFVEPNLAFWQTLQRLVDYTCEGFRKYKLFPSELEKYGKLQNFKRQVKFYTSLAVKELQNQPLTEEEYEAIRKGGLSYMAKPIGHPGAIIHLEEKDRRSGLIADIHTDLLKTQVLYEATGEPYVMLALVGNEGRVRLTVGVAFNHYEFTGHLARRFTDADWQALVYKTPMRLPKKNFWYKDLIVK